MWVYTLVVTLGVSLATAASGLPQLEAGFNLFMIEHGKAYSTSEEYWKRYAVWNDHRALIQRHNEEASRGLHSYTLGMNQFGDMTPEEFKHIMLTFRPNQRSSSWTQTQNCTTLPASVDWKSKGYVTEVGNQGPCGSCWAFSATGALEGQHKKKTGKLVDLSEQNLMDCSGKYGNYGCQGGFMDASYIYVKKNHGIDTEKSYPYDSKDPKVNKCKYKKSNRGATCNGYVDLTKGNETSLQCAIAYVGPVAVAVDASQTSFQLYKSGVYDEPKCDPERVDHTLVVVGYGKENGKQFYNCKNSWGTTWGDQGYIKMVRNKHNQCGIAQVASYPTV